METSHRQRGANPEDERSFGASWLATLRQATRDLCWLLHRIRRESEFACGDLELGYLNGAAS
jgi:hypothetical protein